MSAYNDLIEIIRPLGKASVVMLLSPTDVQNSPHHKNRLLSKFGGVPYIARDEVWPVCPTCSNRLAFICQADLAKAGYQHASNPCFFTFFFCQYCFPWKSWDESKEEWVAEGQWAVRLYSRERFSEALLSEVEPYEARWPLKECMIEFQHVTAYPDYYTLGDSFFAVDAVLQEMDDDWEVYNRAVRELGGITKNHSHIGGYPKWDQEDEPYEPFDFFATIASESKANLLFGDCGHVNLFIDPDDSSVPFMIRQCG